MGNKLEGKIAVITGGLDLAISEIGKNVVGIDGDISNLADLDKLYSVVKDQKGHLDCIITYKAPFP
jgi:NAD(P)-dependent dehydrogenase (short-subunit alcohol dehydrogenase family)